MGQSDDEIENTDSKKRSKSQEGDMENTDNDDSGPAVKKTKTESEKKQRSPDLAKFWKAVEDDPTDFTGWTYLLQFVDTTGDIEDGREAYDAFLFRYPYCYGYWKKYADLEKRKGAMENCMAVFERGIQAISLSADLWIHYLNHVKGEFGNKPEFVRAQYERAIEACGKEWRSDKLWDHYVKWEIQLEKEKEVGSKNYKRVVALYDRILQNPTQGLSHQFDMFKDFVKEHSPRNILEVNDFLAVRREALASMNNKKSKTPEDNDTESKDAPGEEPEEDTPASEEENLAMREKILAPRKKMYKATEEKVQLRWKYEDAIKRPYFHMKPLERGQLKNWAEYLEFQENQMKKNNFDSSDLVILFERCMIACALYEEFWMKYVHWLLRTETTENKEEIEGKVRNVFERACTHHLPGKVDIHMNWAAFEEQRGHYDKALSILTNVESKNPDLLSVLLRRINLERRSGHQEEVHKLYRKGINKATGKRSHAKAELSVKYSRYLRLICKDDQAAKQVLQDILDDSDCKEDSNAKVFLQLLDIELHIHPLNPEAVIQLFDMAISAKTMPGRQKLLFSQRKIEFLEDFGTNISDIQVAKDNHEKLSEEVKKEAKVAEEKGEKVIETIEGHSGGDRKSKASKNGESTTTYAATNSASYNAAHASSYDQYGSRYNYGQYYQGYYQSY